MVWPFNRNKNETEDVPQEVQDYYQSERRDRVGVAWLLAFGTLLLTIALAIALFFGGRWAYRTWFGNDSNESQPVATDENSDSNTSEEQKSESGNGSVDDNAASTTAPTTPATPPTPSPSSSATQSATTPPAPNTGSELPDTGPGDHFD